MAPHGRRGGGAHLWRVAGRSPPLLTRPAFVYGAGIRRLTSPTVRRMRRAHVRAGGDAGSPTRERRLSSSDSSRLAPGASWARWVIAGDRAYVYSSCSVLRLLETGHVVLSDHVRVAGTYPALA